MNAGAFFKLKIFEKQPLSQLALTSPQFREPGCVSWCLPPKNFPIWGALSLPVIGEVARSAGGVAFYKIKSIFMSPLFLAESFTNEWIAAGKDSTFSGGSFFA